SYIVGCQRTGVAIIIEAERDLSKYIEVSDSEGLTITQSTETHIHADFDSGIRDVAKRLNENIYVSGEVEYE
ncbi:MBL fold metallo-hydrolase, partial [Staphylococcus aureus]